MWHHCGQVRPFLASGEAGRIGSRFSPLRISASRIFKSLRFFWSTALFPSSDTTPSAPTLTSHQQACTAVSRGAIDLLPHQLLVSFFKLCRQMHAHFGGRALQLAVMTWMEGGKRGAALASTCDIYEDPLVVLQLPVGMWQRAPLVGALLLILRIAITYRSHRVDEQLIDANVKLQKMREQKTAVVDQTVALHPPAMPGSADALMTEVELREMTTALLVNTEAAAVHMLLELCLAQRQSAAAATAMDEAPHIERLVGAYIHERFITRPEVAKAVHFQGKRGGIADNGSEAVVPRGNGNLREACRLLFSD